MRSGLFVALVLMGQRTTATEDLPRTAEDLSESAPEESSASPPPTGSPTTSAPTNPAGSPITASTPLSGEVTSNPLVANLFLTVARPVNANSIINAFTINAPTTGLVMPGLYTIVYTVTAAPTVTASSDGNGFQVSISVSVDIGAINTDIAGYKAAYVLDLARKLNVLFAQITGFKFRRTLASGAYADFGRQAKGLETTETVEILFSVCSNIGCLGTPTFSIAAYPGATLAIPAVQAALARPVYVRDMTWITNALPRGYNLKSEVYQLPSVDALLQDSPTQYASATDPTTTNILFFLSVNLEWARVSADPALYKLAYQYAIADRLFVNPYQVTDIALVRMSDATTLSRRGESQAVFERVNIHQTVCRSLCATNQHATTPVPSPDDDDQSLIIAVAVVVPVVVVGTLIALYCIFCAAGEEKKGTAEDHEPYGKPGEEEVAEKPEEDPEV